MAERLSYMLNTELLKRDLPSILDAEDFAKESWERRRLWLLDVLQKSIYGITPPPPKEVTGRVLESNRRCCAGKVLEQRIEIAFDTPKGAFTVPISLFVPVEENQPPVILHIAFRPVPDRYIPVEEITDSGFALAVVCYNDIIADSHDGNFDQGIGGMFRDKGGRGIHEWGKIGMWAYGASRVMDYLMTLDGIIDKSRISVMGHSRLGKTALWCAAQDTRFFAVMSNDSGFGGAAVAKFGSGEKIKDFEACGSIDWFCENFKKFDGRENEMPFDQHFLLASMAPRYLYVASAELDKGADPRSEFLSCFAASQVYEKLGYNGLVTKDEFPVVPSSLHEGRIGYHIRRHQHYLSRYDWNEFIKFLKLKIEN